MKQKIVFGVVFLFTLAITSNAQLNRYSNNPIPKLNVFGVALSEDVETAKKMFNGFFKDKLRLELDFNYAADPTYKKLKDQKALDISFFGKSATGKNLNRNLIRILS